MGKKLKIILPLIAAIITIGIFFGIEDFNKLLNILGISKSAEVPKKNARKKEEKVSQIERIKSKDEIKKIPSSKFSQKEKSDKNELQVKEGLLKIVAPEDSLIFIDGKRINSKIIKLSIGSHILEASMPGVWNSPYITKNMLIKSSETIVVVFIVGKLYISCHPFSKIFIDGKYFKETEGGKIDKILQGTHILKIEKLGYPSFEGEFFVKGNVPTRLVIKYNYASRKWEIIE